MRGDIEADDREEVLVAEEAEELELPEDPFAVVQGGEDLVALLDRRQGGDGRLLYKPWEGDRRVRLTPRRPGSGDPRGGTGGGG